MGNYASAKKSKRKNLYQLYTPNIRDMSVQLAVKGNSLPFNQHYEGILEIKVTNADESKCAQLVSQNVVVNSPDFNHVAENPVIIKTHWIDSELVFCLTTKRNGLENGSIKIYRKFNIGQHKFRVLENSQDIEVLENSQDIETNILTFIVTIEEQQPMVDCPDIECLCQEESNFVTVRTPLVCRTIKEMFVDDDDINKIQPEDIPKIAIIGSGGGLRAVIGMSGAMTALQRTNILDCAMYTAGLSGSAWYLMTLYASDSTLRPIHPVLRVDPSEVNETIGQRLKANNENPFQMAIGILQSYRQNECDPTTDVAAANEGSRKSNKTVSNEFGEKIGALLLKEKKDYFWSDMASELDKGTVPLPLVAALHVRNDHALNAHQEWIEFSPYQVYIPRFGAAIGMEHFGKTFKGGFITDNNGRKPIHFLLGMCGSAYTILRNYRPQGFEWTQSMGSSSLLIYLLFNTFDKHFVGTVPNFIYGIDGIDKLPADSDEGSNSTDWCRALIDDIDDDSDSTGSMLGECWRKFKETIYQLAELMPIILAVFNADQPFVTHEGDIWHWHCRKFEDLMWTWFTVLVEPLSDLLCMISDDYEWIDQQENDRTDLRQTNMMLVDAGIAFNSPYPTVLRPAREVDLIISFDFSDRGKDTNWPFEELQKAEKWARKKNIPFPNIRRRLQTIGMEWKRGIYKEMYIFRGDRNAPTIVHFVMINQQPLDQFDIHSNYGTLKFKYTDEEFKQFNSLIQDNVTQNISMIKCLIWEHTYTKILINGVKNRAKRETK